MRILLCASQNFNPKMMVNGYYIDGKNESNTTFSITLRSIQALWIIILFRCSKQ